VDECQPLRDGTNASHLSQYMVWPGELKACLDPASKLPVLLGDGANARVTQAELTGDRWVHGGVSYAGGKARYHARDHGGCSFFIGRFRYITR
jgi:hypothetical protein